MTSHLCTNINLLAFFRNTFTGWVVFVIFLIGLTSVTSCRNRKTKFCPIESCHTKMMHKHAEVPLSDKKKDKIKKKLEKGKDGKDVNAKMSPADSLNNIAKETKKKEKEEKKKAKAEAKKQKQAEKENARLEKEKNDPKAAEKALAKENKKKEKEAKKLAKAEKKRKRKSGESSDSTATADATPIDESKKTSSDSTKSDSLARKGSDYRGRPWYYINQNPKIGQLHRDIQHDDGRYRQRQGFKRRNGNYVYCRFLKSKKSVN